ncbi:MAG: asparagine--tRNA ligase, partial [Cytophagales bacterium]
LRLRTRTFYAVFRIRHALSQAIHTFFSSAGFSWVHTPILTGVDAEGAGEMFGITTHGSSGKMDASFFKKKMFLTVSGQLAGEAAAMGLGKIYTFGPTFRAEDSNTPRHLAEFWMIEPEMAFYDLSATILLAEQLLKHVIRHVLAHCDVALAFLEKRLLQEVAQQKSAGKAKKDQKNIPLRDRLRNFVAQPLVCITYTEAISLLQAAQQSSPSRFVYPLTWGVDLQREHEHYLTDHFQGGVVVTHYPRAVKAFYMYQNEDGKTVDAMDVLLPGIGEIIGGAARETRLEKLTQAMQAFGVDLDAMDWYLDLRRFGTVPHSGFGLGLERLVSFVTGMGNVRDVTLFPRTPGPVFC